MTRFAIPASCAGLLLAGSILFFGSPARSGEPAAAKRPFAATRKIVGRALDVDGRPVGGATVCLSRDADSDDVLAEPIVLAQAHTRADGWFELLALECDLKKLAAEPLAACDLWIKKSGLGLAHTVLSIETTGEPLMIALKSESRMTVCLRDPGGLPCGDATVAPILLLLADDRWAGVPKPIREALRVHSRADGRVAVTVFDGRGQTLTVATSEFGVQSLVIMGKQSCPLTVTLNKTRLVKGRFLLPDGKQVDLSRTETYLDSYNRERNRSRCSQGHSDAYWWIEQAPTVSQDGQFTAPTLTRHSSWTIRINLSTDMPMMPDFSPRWSLAWQYEKSRWGRGLVIRCGLPARPISPIVAEAKFRIETVLPTEVALIKAVWDAVAQKDLQFDIALRKGVEITRVFRDSFTKRPIAGVRVRIRPATGRRPVEKALKTALWVAQLTGLPLVNLRFPETCAATLNRLIALLCGSVDVDGEVETDSDGRIRVPFYPGRFYEMSYERQEGDLPGQQGRVEVVQVPTGVDKIELKPVDVVRLRTLNGHIENASGRPLTGVRIRATCGTGGRPPQHADAADVSRLTTSDVTGNFHFEHVTGGMKVTLEAVRDGVPLTDPIEITANDKPIRLLEKKHDLVALGGKIIGTDHKPIAGAEIVVAAEHSPDPTYSFRTTTGEDGSFRTPARFPKHLKYRVTVRRILKDVASSQWLCPATSGTQFRDLAVDRAKLGLGSRIELDEVVARVNGQPIRASEIFERACAEPLSPSGMSLLAAAARVVSGEMAGPEYRALQEIAIRKYLRDYIRTRLLTQAIAAKMDANRKKQVEQSIDNLFEKYTEMMKGGLKVTSCGEVDQKLRQMGTSLNSVKVEFRYRLLADEWLRQAGREENSINWQQALAYYNAHRDLYAESEKVAWQLLEIQFDSPAIEQAQSQEKDSADDPFLRASQLQQASPITGLDDRFKLDVNDLYPQSNNPKSPASDTQSSVSTKDAGSDKPAEAGPKKSDEIDVVAYADRLPKRLDSRKARRQIREALSHVQKGEPFDAVVKKYSNGPHADCGGWQSRINQGSIADKATADALRHLAEGQTSGIIETERSFRVVRVVSRTPAGSKPFEDVLDSIKQTIERQRRIKALTEVYSQATIECPSIDDVTSILPPPPSWTPKPRDDDAFAQ
jgi:parvulin-like peptidyl-prolyl isomerase